MKKSCTMMLAILGLAATARAESMTIATFDDPSVGADAPLFTFNGANRMLSGGWSIPGLTLETVSGTFNNVRFTMPPVFVDGANQADPGEITFRNASNQVIFRVNFDSAQLSVTGLGATEFLATNNVMFTGSILPAPVFAESFSFGFANQTALPNGGFTATASFTSSAEIIPEPATAMLIIVGGLGALYRRRI